MLGVKTSVVCSSVITVVADVETAKEGGCVMNSLVTIEVNVLISLTVDGTTVGVSVVKADDPGVDVVTLSDTAVLSSVAVVDSLVGTEAVVDTSSVSVTVIAVDVIKPVLSASVISTRDVDVSVLGNVSTVLGVKTSVVCSSVITVVADVEKDVETAAEVDCVVN